MSRRAPADGRARAGGGDASGRRERTAPVELRSLDLLNGVRRQPLGYNRPTVQALPYSTIPRVYEVEIVTLTFQSCSTCWFSAQLHLGGSQFGVCCVHWAVALLVLLLHN